MYRIVLFPFYLLSLFPIWVLYRLADGIAFLLRKVFHYRKSTVYINISRSFPELKYKEIDKIAKSFYTYMADIFVEAIWSITATNKQIAKKVEIANPEVLNEIYHSYGKAIIVSGHTGNWELLGSALCQPVKGKDTDYRKANYIILYKKAKSKFANSIMEGYRKRAYRRMKNNGRIVDSHAAIPYMEEHEEDKNFYFFIADQSAKKTSRFVVDFLNQESLMIAGPESLARNFNMPVVYANMDRYKRGKYRITFTVICKDSRQTKRGYITGKYITLLEEDIKANKPCWLWSHRRWKFDASDITHRLYRVDKAEFYL